MVTESSRNLEICQKTMCNSISIIAQFSVNTILESAANAVWEI